MRPFPFRLLPDSAEVVDGRVQVGGCDLIDLAAEFGTPLFVYDEDHLRARCREAVAAFPDGAAYATKAFLCGAMAQLAHEEGMQLDVATGGELQVALRAGVPADQLIFHGNNKSSYELNMALEAASPRKQAVVQSGTLRFRSIIWTSCTTAAGLMPIMSEGSLQVQVVMPMAVSLSFGIIFATAITLLLVPSLYVLQIGGFDRSRAIVNWLFAREQETAADSIVFRTADETTAEQAATGREPPKPLADM